MVVIAVRVVAGVLLLAHGLVHLLYLTPGVTEFSTGRSWLLTASARQPVALTLIAVTVAAFALVALAVWRVPVLANIWPVLTIVACLARAESIKARPTGPARAPGRLHADQVPGPWFPGVRRLLNRSRHRGEEARMAHIDGEIIIAAPIEQVFDMVADERNEPRYNPRITRAEKVSPGPVGPGTRFTARPRGMGTSGVMTMQILDYDRPHRLRSSIRSSYMNVDGTLTFAPVEGGTRMRWSWDMTLRRAMRALTPLLRAVGPRWEHHNWAGLKQFLEREPHDGAGMSVQ